MTEQTISFNKLKVTVIGGQNIPSEDFLSDSDCYVTLHLPTASAKVYRTRTVTNSQNPTWKETFNFRVRSNLKNILEIRMYDDDTMKPDPVMFRQLFDICELTPGEKETKVFIIDPKTKSELWIEFELLKSLKPTEKYRADNLVREAISYQILIVTILRAHNHHTKDYGSESDCYVVLKLPTASARTHRTKTVSNTKNPEWNETFTFRVPHHVKNVLEINLYDEDNRKDDDHISTLIFDISKLTPGRKETKVFITNAKTKDELLVEFELLQSDEPAHEYRTNGILLAAPLSILDVRVDKLRNNKKAKNMSLKLRGAYQENINEGQLRFYVNRDLDTELGMVQSDKDVTDDATSSVVPLLSATKLQLLSDKNEDKVSLLIDEDTVDLELQTSDCTTEDLEMRLEFGIPQQEKAFLEKRKVLVGQALQKVLGLNSPPEPQKVPVIAVVGSGGGTRAMTGLFGGLRGLQQIGVLDTATYITGVSGSTWTMSSLYQQNDWSQQDIDNAISAMEEKITKSFSSSFSIPKVQYYNSEMDERRKEGHIMSYVHMWGLIIEHLIFEKKTTTTLSNQERAVIDGQNPFPIYTAVNMKDEIEGCEPETEWCEFTPYEIGIEKYGAFVRTEDFGSQFFLGHMIKKLPELSIPYLIGIWSSAFSVNLTQLWQFATGSEPSWSTSMGPDVSSQEADSEESTMDTRLVNPATKMANKVTNFFKSRPVVAQVSNFMRGLLLHWNYNKHSNFKAWKETHPDAFPNRLTPTDPLLNLVDAGHAINIGCIPVLRPQRDVDLIISLSYSWEPNKILKDLEKTSAYCKEHELPFPNVDFDRVDTKDQKEVYIFEDRENPKAPIVVHFPLVNTTYKQFKAPGVPRRGEKELKAGKVDVKTDKSPYKTKHLTYTKEDFRALVNLTSYNVINNKESVLKAINRALERKATKMPQ